MVEGKSTCWTTNVKTRWAVSVFTDILPQAMTIPACEKVRLPQHACTEASDNIADLPMIYMQIVVIPIGKKIQPMNYRLMKSVWQELKFYLEPA